MTRFFILALLLAGCSEPGKARAPAVVVTPEQSGISVSNVEKVHLTAGFNVISAGQRQVVNDGVLLRVSGLDPQEFMPRAMPPPDIIVGSSIAKVVIYPPLPTGEARVLAPLPPPGSQVTLWLTPPDVMAMNLDATAVERERQRAMSTTRSWCTFTAPSDTATTRQYATFNELKLAESRRR